MNFNSPLLSTAAEDKEPLTLNDLISNMEQPDEVVDDIFDVTPDFIKDYDLPKEEGDAEFANHSEIGDFDRYGDNPDLPSLPTVTERQSTDPTQFLDTLKKIGDIERNLIQEKTVNKNDLADYLRLIQHGEFLQKVAPFLTWKGDGPDLLALNEDDQDLLLEHSHLIDDRYNELSPFAKAMNDLMSVRNSRRMASLKAKVSAITRNAMPAPSGLEQLDIDFNDMDSDTTELTEENQAGEIATTWLDDEQETFRNQTDASLSLEDYSIDHIASTFIKRGLTKDQVAAYLTSQGTSPDRVSDILTMMRHRARQASRDTSDQHALTYAAGKGVRNPVSELDIEI